MSTMTRAITFHLKCVTCGHKWVQTVRAGQDDGPLCPLCLGPSVVTKVQG
jgi:hypothetical protein